MQATKLDLRIWICAVFLVLTSSKGISSVVMSTLLRVNQKTAQTLGHRIREMMDDRNGELMPLEDEVEVDKGYLGSAPKSLSGADSPPGRGTGKPMVFVAASLDGQARAQVVPDGTGETLDTVLETWIVRANTTLMTDGLNVYTESGKTRKKPLAGGSMFAAVGGATEAVARVWAFELAPIRVNTIVPGIIETPVWGSLMDAESARATRDSTAAALPVGRVGQPDDIAKGVSFLIDNGLVNGHALVIDGGHRLI